MISILRNLSFAVLLASLAYGAADGTISGTVKDAAGAPFKGAFVRARNVKTKITVDVLSDSQGRYRASNLPPGEYEVRATAVGHQDDQHTGVKLAAGESASLDFALQNGTVRWNELTKYQGERLLPSGKGKDLLMSNCFECHHFQSRMATTPRDEAGWRARINYMRETEGYRREVNSLNDQQFDEIVAYLTKYFGPNSNLPSPADLPGYKETVRTFPDEAMKIVYVDYEMPGPNRYPFSAAPAKDGYFWIPYFGRANQIGRLDPATGEVQEFPVPNKGTAGIHSAVPSPDGTVWAAEQGSGKLAMWDPTTRTVNEFPDPGLRTPDGTLARGKHTVRVDLAGRVWSSGVVSMFDPKTKEYAHFPDAPSAYGIVLDTAGNAWFTEYPKQNGQFGRVDGKTGKVTRYDTPTPNAGPRRIQIASDGMIWFAEYKVGKIARFDPKTETFKEYPLPGPSPTPYAFEIDSQGRLWYSSFDMDTVGCLDPRTGKVIEYPFPYRENTMREFFRDSQGRMWFGTPANNKVGYFIPPTGS